LVYLARSSGTEAVTPLVDSEEIQNAYIYVVVLYSTLLHMCDCGRSHRWYGYPERGWIQFLLLRLLQEKPMHGYQLMEELKTRSCGCHRIEPGSIYTILRRMEAAGLLKSRWEHMESGPDRRIYTITEAGTEALRTGLEVIVRRKALTDDLIEFYMERFAKSKEAPGDRTAQLERK
jgi:DNA-binding PadR family transcriptional regulator